MPSDPALNLQHLHAELARLDQRLAREIRRWQLAGQNPADNFRGLSVSDAEASALLKRPPGFSWGQTVALKASDEHTFTAARHAAEKNIAALKKQAAPNTLRLERLAQVFGLDAFDLDAFLICLAPAVDVRYERLYGYLQDDVTRKRPTVNLILNLLAVPGPERLSHWARFADDAPLFRHRLVRRVSEATSLLAQDLAPDEAIVAWVLGEYRPNADLGPHAFYHQPEGGESDAALVLPVQAELEALLAAEARPLLIFHGADHASQHAAARWVAAHQKRPLLLVDLSGADRAARESLIQLTLRDAQLTEAVPFVWLGESSELSASAGAALFAYADWALVGGRAEWQPRGFPRQRRLARLEFPIPDYTQRHALWAHYLHRAGVQAAPSALAPLAGQFLLTPEQIRDAIGSARDAADQRGTPLAEGDLFAAARAHSNPNLGSLARKVTAQYQWDDIILPADQLTLLREIMNTVRGRPKVLDEWGVGRKLAASAGVAMLFAGQPGTGKTMAAGVIARELGLDLYKIDLSTLVSKYIGETEKNLERIFVEAQTSNAILFFDEADAIFGKRSEVKDAHDRYANVEVSYLLQRMEAYDGVTILATNLRANLDEAFTRRLQFAVDFPFPDEPDRLRIWETLFPPDVPRAPDLDLNLLARRFKLAGGNIRNVIISAAYLAAADGGPVTMAHLLHGIRREMQKMGRLVRELDLVSSS